MQPSEFLSNLDGHGIYPASVLSELDPEYRNCVPQFTHSQTVNAIRRRGLGGELAPDTGEKLIYGYSTATALATRCLGHAPGSAKAGRDSSFRMDLAGLEEGGF